MNKLSGYRLFRLSDGAEVELKFSNGTFELFGEMMGFTTLEEIDAALRPPMKDATDGQGNPVKVPHMTLAYMKVFKIYVLAAARYAALAQNKPDTFNEWQAAEWIDEIGYDAILGAEEKGVPQNADAKKKPKDRIKATQ